MCSLATSFPPRRSHQEAPIETMKVKALVTDLTDLTVLTYLTFTYIYYIIYYIFYLPCLATWHCANGKHVQKNGTTTKWKKTVVLKHLWHVIQSVALSVVLPILGAVPDGMSASWVASVGQCCQKNQLEPTWPKFVSALRMVLFSGLGLDAQNQVIVCALFFCITVFKFYGS